MGFKFGELDRLNETTALLGFLGVILFVVTVEFFLGIIEFLLSENDLFNRMIQTIYKGNPHRRIIGSTTHNTLIYWSFLYNIMLRTSFRADAYGIRLVLYLGVRGRQQGTPRYHIYIYIYCTSLWLISSH